MDTIDIGKQDELQESGGTFLEKAKELVIIGNDGYTYADELRQSGRAHKKKVDTFMDPLISVAHASHKGLTTAKNDLTGPAIEGIKILGTKMEVYDAEQKRIAEEERKRLEAEVNHQAKLDAEEALLAEALEAEEAGDTRQAESLLEEAKDPAIEPIFVSPPARTTPKVSTSFRTTYKADRVNFDKDKVPLAYMEINFSAVDNVLRSTKGAISIPGITILKDRVPVG